MLSTWSSQKFCHLVKNNRMIYLFTTQSSRLLTTRKKKAFENNVFDSYAKQISNFQPRLFSANAFRSNQSKDLSFGKELTLWQTSPGFYAFEI